MKTISAPCGSFEVCSGIAQAWSVTTEVGRPVDKDLGAFGQIGGREYAKAGTVTVVYFFWSKSASFDLNARESRSRFDCVVCNLGVDVVEHALTSHTVSRFKPWVFLWDILSFAMLPVAKVWFLEPVRLCIQCPQCGLWSMYVVFFFTRIRCVFVSHPETTSAS
jgi:hypothetical protein